MCTKYKALVSMPIKIIKICSSICIFIMDIILPRKKTSFSKRYLNDYKVRTDTVAQETIEAVKATLNLNQKRIFLESDHSMVKSDGSLINALTLFRYKTPEIKRLIWNAKYYNEPYSVRAVADIWSDELISIKTDRVGFYGSLKTLLVHPPSSSLARQEKDFDQMKVIIETMIQNTSLENFYEYFTNAIETKSTAAQHLKDKKGRMENMKNKFKLNKEFIKILNLSPDLNLDPSLNLNPNPNLNVISIMYLDDILTTGATLSSISNLMTDTISKVSQNKNVKINLIEYFSTFAH
jgi:predicted amidophosphoribosyltransferase